MLQWKRLSSTTNLNLQRRRFRDASRERETAVRVQCLVERGPDRSLKIRGAIVPSVASASVEIVLMHSRSHMGYQAPPPAACLAVCRRRAAAEKTGWSPA